jgi:hypothetical protein
VAASRARLRVPRSPVSVRLCFPRERGCTAAVALRYPSERRIVPAGSQLSTKVAGCAANPA